MLWHVLHEGVLRHVWAALRSCARSSTSWSSWRERGVVIQVLSLTAGDYPRTDGPILVYDFYGAPSVAYTECKGGGRIVDSVREVGGAGDDRLDDPAASFALGKC